MGEYGYTGQAWPQEKVDELIKLHQEGYSAGIIAEKLGVSRNAAIGKAWRMGLSFSRTTQTKQPERKPVRLTNQQLANLAKGRLLNIRKQFMAKEKNLTKNAIELGSKHGVDIHGLVSESGVPMNCRAILHGTGIDAIYCGKPIYARSYCHEHFRRFYHVSREEQRAADRAAGYK